MRKLIFIILIFIYSPILAQDAVPDIEFEEVIYDFGEVYEGEVLTHIFKFKNVGKAELNIEKVATSCGCTHSMLSSNKLLPGAVGEIMVSFDSKGRSGEQKKIISVRSNDPDEASVKLQISCLVKEIVVINPKRVYFGEGKLNTLSEKVEIVKVFPVEDDKLNLDKIDSSSEYLQVTTKELRAGAKKGFQIEVTLGPNTPVGNLNERILIQTNNKRKSVIEIPVSAVIKSEIEINPETLFFGWIKKGDMVSKKVIITNTGEKDLEILKVESNLKSIFTSVSPIKEGEIYEITVIMKLEDETGKINGKIDIHTNNYHHPVSKVLVKGWVKDKKGVSFRLIENLDKESRKEAIIMLGEMRDKGAIGVLNRVLLEDEDEDIRESAVLSLTKIGSKKVIKPLIKALKDEDSWVRTAAVEGLGKIGGTEVIKYLEQALKDEDEDVRESAEIELKRLRKIADR